MIFSLSGCFDRGSIRQENLEQYLSKHYDFQQKKGTKVSPPQYIVCDKADYGCRSITHIYLNGLSYRKKEK